MAAPHVAGAAALVTAATRARGETLAADQIAALLKAAADPTKIRAASNERAAPALARVGSGALDIWSAVSAGAIPGGGASTCICPGFMAISQPAELLVPLTLVSRSDVAQSYRLEPHLRVAENSGPALSIVAEPDEIVLLPGLSQTVTVRVRALPHFLTRWEMRGGESVASSDLLQESEIDGWLELWAEENTASDSPELRIPVYSLARSASAVRSGTSLAAATLRAGSRFTVALANESIFPGDVEVFEVAAERPSTGRLRSRADVDLVGIRSVAVQDEGTIVAVAIHTRGVRPHPAWTRSTVELDTDLDGSADFVAYTVDEELVRSRQHRSGKIAVALEEAGGSPFGSPTMRYYADVDLHSRWTVLPFRLEDTGLTPSTASFGFRVRHEDLSSEAIGEPAPSAEIPGSGWLRFDSRSPALQPEATSYRVAGSVSSAIRIACGPGFSELDGAGLLLYLPDNAPGDGDVAVVRIPGWHRAFLPALWRP
jgi:hypothetical protein